MPTCIFNTTNLAYNPPPPKINALFRLISSHSLDHGCIHREKHAVSTVAFELPTATVSRVGTAILILAS